jgi:peptidoglycan glycosyltransferase
VSSRTPEAERRRRLVTRTLPLALLAVAAFVAGAALGAPGSPGKEAANRFAAAWGAHNFKAMYGELNDSSRAAVGRAAFVMAYREAELVATQRGLLAGSAGEPTSIEGRTVVPIPVTIETVAFGKLEDQVGLPYDEGGIDWNPSLVFPGLRSGEKLEAELELAPRAAILAADGEPLAEGPVDEREHPLGEAMIDVTGEIGEASEEGSALLARQGYPPGSPVGVSGLEQAFNRRLAGKPGGKLLAVPAGKGGGQPRTLAQSPPQPGAPVKTTIDPEIQEAAVAALAGRVGGIAVLDAKDGDVRAIAGQAYSAPQPPGSTFKIITTTAALQDHLVTLEDEFEINDGINVGGRFLNNANGEYCGGTFRQAFAQSCNSVFAPLGPKIGNDDLVAAAEAFGFNHPLTLYAPQLVRAVDPAESTIPQEIGEEVDLGVSAIGQGEVLATPLEMASVAQTIANDGVREPTSIVNNKRLRPHPESTRVMSKALAGELTELMIGVVTEGTGTAGAIEQGQVAGKTGTAELGPKPGQEDAENPIQRKDAWFSAFVPANKPKLAIGVLLIEAEAAGGEVAAPAAAEVLSVGMG